MRLCSSPLVGFSCISCKSVLPQSELYVRHCLLAYPTIFVHRILHRNCVLTLFNWADMTSVLPLAHPFEALSVVVSIQSGLACSSHTLLKLSHHRTFDFDNSKNAFRYHGEEKITFVQKASNTLLSAVVWLKSRNCFSCAVDFLVPCSYQGPSTVACNRLLM